MGNYFIGSILVLEQFSDKSPFALSLVEGVKQVNKSAQVQDFVKVLLDGQQRITALYYALKEPSIALKNRTNDYKFYLDLDRALMKDWDDAVEAVSVRDAKRLFELSKNPKAITFKTVMNRTEIIERFRKDTQLTEIYEIVDSFLKREIHTIELPRDTTSERIVETFERINRTGKPLTTFELLTARLYKSGIKLRELLSDAKKNYKFLQCVDPEAITKVIAILRGKEPKKKFVLELDPSNFRQDWDCACVSLENAYTRLVDIKNGYGAFDFDRWMPYSTMIVPLACLLNYIKTNKFESKSNYDKIDRWYWASVFTKRYDQSVDTTSTSDVDLMKNWLNDDSKIPDFILGLNLDTLDWRIEKQSSAIYRGVLNLVVLAGALDFQTGQPPQFDHKHVEDDHIFPKSVYNLNWFPNRTLITKNREKTNRKPSDYFKELLDQHGRIQLLEILKSHLIPEEALDSLLNDDKSEFLRLRSHTILNQVRARLHLPSIPLNGFVLEPPPQPSLTIPQMKTVPKDKDLAGPHPENLSALLAAGLGESFERVEETNVYKNPNKILVARWSKRYKDKAQDFWYKLTPQDILSIEESHITHFAYICADEGVILIPSDTMQKHIKAGTLLYTEKKGNISHYHIHFAISNSQASWILKGGTREDLLNLFHSRHLTSG